MHLDAVAARAGTIRALTTIGIGLVNNAGIPGAPTSLMGEDGYERILQVEALTPAFSQEF